MSSLNAKDRHDINNNLTVVMGFGSMLPHVSPEKQLKYAEMIIDAVDKIDVIIVRECLCDEENL